MSSNPTVAVCIPTYNQAKYLPLAIESALKQTYPVAQVWVSDDASTDDTPSLLAEMSGQYSNLFVVRQPKNIGIAENNSDLLSRPETDYVVRLDSDDILELSYVEMLVSAMERHPLAGYGHASIQEIDALGQPTSVRYLNRSVEFEDAETALKASLKDYKVAANIVMFRREVLSRLNYYHGRPEFVEDYDLSVRIADAGYGNVYVGKVLARYRVWADDGQKRLKRKHLQLSGYERIYGESMTAAFARRGWDERAIRRQRRIKALAHATYCYLPLFTLTERRELEQLLLRLGDSPQLRIKLRLLKLGLAPVFQWQEALLGSMRRIVKGTLSAHRIRSGAGTS